VTKVKDKQTEHHRISNHSQAPAKLCGVEQRAPVIFRKAAITLGISPF